MSKDQKQVEVKRDTKSLILKNLIVMAVLIAIALTGVVSWFTNRTKATADGINVTCETPDGLEIAVVEHGAAAPESSEYATGEIDLTDTKKYPFLEKLSMEEITSDGVHFYKPKLTQDSSGAKVDTTSSEPWNDAEENSYLNRGDNSNISYFSVDIYMRSKSGHSISLGGDTSITPDKKDYLTGNNIANKSEYGDFSKNCVVGAVRLSTVDGSTCNNLWIPAPNILYTESVDSEGSPSRDVSVAVKDTSQSSYKHKYWNVDTSTKKLIGNSTLDYNDVITNNSCDYTLGEDHSLTTLTNTNNSEYYTSKITLNIWIDGEDSEARLAMVGGKFSANIKLRLED